MSKNRISYNSNQSGVGYKKYPQTVTRIEIHLSGEVYCKSLIRSPFISIEYCTRIIGSFQYKCDEIQEWIRRKHKADAYRIHATFAGDEGRSYWVVFAVQIILNGLKV